MAHTDLRSRVFNTAILESVQGDAVDLDTHTFHARLCREENSSNAHPGHHASDATKDNVNRRIDLMSGWDADDTNHMFNGNVVDGGQYIVADDVPLTGITVTSLETSNNNFIEFKAFSVTWTQVGERISGDKASGVLIYHRVGGSVARGTDIPICFIKFDSEIDPDNSDLTVKWGGTATDSVRGTILKFQQAAD